MVTTVQGSYDDIDKIVPLATLDCGHPCDSVDWENDLDMKILSALYLADQEFIYQLCLVDPDLLCLVHGDHATDHCHPHSAPYNFQTNISLYPDVVYQKLLLIETIVFVYGDDGLRGWELTDLDKRMTWSVALSDYLQPLWANDRDYADEMIGGYRPSRVTQSALWELETLEEVQEREIALLQFWMRVLQRDHAIVAVPFFPSPEVRGNWMCAVCRSMGSSSPLSTPPRSPPA